MVRKSFLITMAMLVCAVTASVLHATDESITLVDEGQTNYKIVYPADATEVDNYAVEQLQQYLGQMAGIQLAAVQPDAVASGDRCIFVGQSQPMETRLGSKRLTDLDAQQHIACSANGDIYLYGEGIHGNLNAVFLFLESELGWRWYTVSDPPIMPSRTTATLKPFMHKRGFDYLSREVAIRWDYDFYYQHGMNQGYYHRLSESRLQDPDRLIHRRFVSYLPTTKFVHSLHSYIPPNKERRGARDFPWQDKHDYFQTNPEFFSLNAQGKRVPDMQLCLSNSALRAELTRNILRDIQYNGERILVTVDAHDTPGKFCHCQSCQDLESKYQSPGGPLYDYLVDLCKTLKQSHPQTRVRMLAYRRSQTQIPPILPDGGKLPENLIVAFAPIEDAFFADWTHPDEKIQETFTHLRKWAEITHHLWAWIYPNPFGTGTVMPVGNVDRLITNVRLMHQAGVTGLFSDHAGYLSRSGWSELQQYLLFKLMQDVNCNTDEIIAEFTEYQYGSAAPLARKYLAELEQARKTMDVLPGGVRYKSSSYGRETFPYLTNENIHRWQSYFDQMLQQVEPESREAKNVQLLRRELDFATLEYWFDLQEAYPTAFGNGEQVIERIKHANSFTTDRIRKFRKLGESRLLDLKMRLDAGGKEKPLPEEFDGIDRSRIRTFLPRTQRNLTEPQKDSDAPFGYAATVHQPQMPFRAGYCEWTSRNPSVTNRSAEIHIEKSQITPGKYQLFELGEIQITVHDAIIWFGRSWATHLQIGNRLYQVGEENRWQAFASLKFDGPSYGGSAPEDIVLVGRIILVSLDGHEAVTVAPAEPVEKVKSTTVMNDWSGRMGDSDMEPIDDNPVRLINGIGQVSLAKPIAIDPTKAYRISGYFRSADKDQPSRTLLDVMYRTADSKRISTMSIYPVSPVNTVKATASKGSTTILLNKHDDWETDARSRAVALHAKEDFSDLPNANTLGVKQIEKQDDAIVLTLNKPLQADIAVGTKVRMQRYADYPRVWNNSVPNQWTKMSFVIRPDYKPGEWPRNIIWPGAALMDIVIRNQYQHHPKKLPKGEEAPQLYFHSVTVSELE